MMSPDPKVGKINLVSYAGIASIIGLIYWAGLPVETVKVATVCQGITANCEHVYAVKRALPFGLDGYWGLRGAAIDFAFCERGCTVMVLYDQTGHGRDLFQSTPTERPNLDFSPFGPSIYFPGTGEHLRDGKCCR